MTVVLGSASVLKLNALKNALAIVGWTDDVQALATKSGVPEQPVGREEIAKGAMNRATAAHLKVPEAYAVGVENGLREAGGVQCAPLGTEVPSLPWYDMAYIVVIKPDGTKSIVPSAYVEVPLWAVQEAQALGFDTTTVGSVLAKRHNIPADDPHTFLTSGHLSRHQILVEALVNALNFAR